MPSITVDSVAAMPARRDDVGVDMDGSGQVKFKSIFTRLDHWDAPFPCQCTRDMRAIIVCESMAGAPSQKMAVRSWNRGRVLDRSSTSRTRLIVRRGLATSILRSSEALVICHARIIFPARQSLSCTDLFFSGQACPSDTTRWAMGKIPERCFWQRWLLVSPTISRSWCVAANS